MDYSKNTATNTKFINIFLYTGRIHFFHYSFFFYLSELFNYINTNIYNWKEAKQFHTASDGKQQQRRRYRAVSNWRRNNNSYGNPSWKIGAGLRFRPLRRDFLQDCWPFKAALKPKSSTTRCCWDGRGGLAFSKRLFTGLRLIFLFLDFPVETRKLLGPGSLTEGVLNGAYSTRPSTTIFKILTPDRDAKSSDDGLMPSTAYYCSCESVTALRLSTAWFLQAQTSATTCERDSVSTWLHGSKTVLIVMVSEIATDSANIVTPESGKNFHCVKCGLLTKSCTQSRAPRTSSSQIITRSRLMTNFSPEVTGPRTMRAVSWKT